MDRLTTGFSDSSFRVLPARGKFQPQLNYA
jgi:hypothetical protein